MATERPLHQQRSHREKVREEELAGVRAALEEYRKFKELGERWVALALEPAHARRERELRRRKGVGAKSKD